jgi:hypothetical protein
MDCVLHMDTDNEEASSSNERSSIEGGSGSVIFQLYIPAMRVQAACFPITWNKTQVTVRGCRVEVIEYERKEVGRFGVRTGRG